MKFLNKTDNNFLKVLGNVSFPASTDDVLEFRDSVEG
jgi:hypothetical protein